LSQTIRWGVPGEHFTIAKRHEVEYCRGRYGDGFLNALHDSNGYAIVRFVAKNELDIVLMADDGDEHETYCIELDAMSYRMWLDRELDVFRRGVVTGIDADTFGKRVTRLAEEHRLATQLIEDINSQLMPSQAAVSPNTDIVIER